MILTTKIIPVWYYDLLPFWKWWSFWAETCSNLRRRKRLQNCVPNAITYYISLRPRLPKEIFKVGILRRPCPPYYQNSFKQMPNIEKNIIQTLTKLLYYLSLPIKKEVIPHFLTPCILFSNWSSSSTCGNHFGISLMVRKEKTETLL